MPVSPTQIVLKRLRETGYIAAVVEHWNPHIKARQDLLGFIDILALGHGHTLAVQACTQKHHAARRTKILTNRRQALVACLEAGWSVEIWSVEKRAGRWHLRTESMADAIVAGPS